MPCIKEECLVYLTDASHGAERRVMGNDGRQHWGNTDDNLAKDGRQQWDFEKRSFRVFSCVLSIGTLQKITIVSISAPGKPLVLNHLLSGKNVTKLRFEL